MKKCTMCKGRGWIWYFTFKNLVVERVIKFICPKCKGAKYV